MQMKTDTDGGDAYRRELQRGVHNPDGPVDKRLINERILSNNAVMSYTYYMYTYII